MLRPGHKEALGQSLNRFFASVSPFVEVGTMSLRSLWIGCFIFPKAYSVLPASFILLTRSQRPLGKLNPSPHSLGVLRETPIPHVPLALAPSAVTCHNTAELQPVCPGIVLPAVKLLNLAWGGCAVT